MNLLAHPLLPALLAMAAVTLAAYVIFDFVSFVSARYRNRFLQEAAMELDDVLLQVPAGRVLDLSLALSAAVLIVVGLLTAVLRDGAWITGIVIGLVAAGLIFPVPRLVLRTLRRRRLQKFEEQLEDALMSISSSLKAGFSIAQAIDTVAAEGRPPISLEFQLLSRECRLGVPLPQALENLAARLHSADFDLVATAIITARQTGGELTQTLERLAGLVRERMRINAKIRSITAMGRMQAWIIGAMPFLLLLGIRAVAPDILSGLFDSMTGYAMIFVILLLDIAGFLTIRKITAIDV